MYQTLVVIDDFLDIADEIRSRALAMDYPVLPGEQYFPGRNSAESLRIQGMDELISRIVGEPLQPAEGTSHGKFRLALEGERGKGGVHIHVGEVRFTFAHRLAVNAQRPFQGPRVASGCTGLELSCQSVGYSWTPSEPSMELYSSQQRSCLAVGRLRLDFIPTPLSSLGSSLKGGREASSDVLPFIAPTRVQLSIERHCWHTVLQPNACACMLIELTAPHIALSISPCHISAIVDIYHAICSSFPPAPTPQDRNSASQTVLPTDTTISGSPAQPLHNSSAPAASATALHFSRDDLRDGGEFNLLPRAGGRAAAFTISQSASGGDEAWISWRYPLPRLVTLVRLGSPEDSTQPASMQHRRQGSFGSADAKAMPYLVELRRWEMMRERFEVVATARLSSLADTCELRAATSQTGGAGPTAGASGQDSPRRFEGGFEACRSVITGSFSST